MRAINQKGFEIIKSYEGYSATPYLDSAQKWTIGYGHRSGVTAFTKAITVAQAESYLEHDIGNAAAAISANVHVPLNDNQYAALLSLIFNAGPAPLFGRLGQLLNQNNYMGAADEFNRWVYAQGNLIPGLVRRRNSEKNLFLSTES